MMQRLGVRGFARAVGLEKARGDLEDDGCIQRVHDAIVQNVALFEAGER